MRRVALLVIMLVIVMTGGYAASQEREYDINSSAWGDVYFGTLSAELDDRAKTTVEELHEWLKEYPGSMVLLAGYDDQRTPVDQSIELGRKRAEAVRDYLVSLGADPEMIRMISFGNTRVALPGEGEEVWSKNRRVRYRVVPPEDPSRMEGRPAGVCQKCKR